MILSKDEIIELTTSDVVIETLPAEVVLHEFSTEETKTLKLTLKKKWFDMIFSGEKKEEYREMKEHWHRRLATKQSRCTLAPIEFKKYDVIEFRNGYKKDSPAMFVECKRVAMGYGIKDWGAEQKIVYIIYLGKVLSHNNCEHLIK